MPDGGDGPVIAGYTFSHLSGDVGSSYGNTDVWVVKLKEWKKVDEWKGGALLRFFYEARPKKGLHVY